MGLDVVLYRFADCDTDALLNLHQQVESFWALQWQHRDPSELTYPTDRMRMAARQILGPVCESLGLPADIHEGIDRLAVQIDYSLHDAPACPFRAGTWDNGFSNQMSLLSTLFRTPKRIEYEFFPEAIGDPSFVKPKWRQSRSRMQSRLAQLTKMTDPDFMNIAHFDPDQDYAELCDGLKVMIETMDCVLRDERPDEFLLGWLA